MRLVVALLAFLFLSVAASAHGLDGVASPAMKAPAGHSVQYHSPVPDPAEHHQDPSDSMHCPASGVCTTASGIAANAGILPSRRGVSAWPVALENLLRAHVPDRDPPVPRA